MCHSVFLSTGRFLSEKKERAKKLTPQMASKQSFQNDAKQSSHMILTNHLQRSLKQLPQIDAKTNISHEALVSCH